MQGLILEGLATVPVQRLKLEALRERLQEILFNIDDGESETLYGREFFFLVNLRKTVVIYFYNKDFNENFM